jgi:two-component system, cell cycle sensor histidine kinase and response regulator CckA
LKFDFLPHDWGVMPGIESIIDTSFLGAIDLASLVEHRESVPADATVEHVYHWFNHHRQEYIGVLDGPRLIGMVSHGQIGFLLGARFGLAVYGRHAIRQHLMERHLCIRRDAPLLKVLEAALSRTGDQFHDDVALVDDADHFLGIISVQTLVQCQSKLVWQQIQQAERQQRVLKESEYFFKESQRAAFVGSYKCDFLSGVWESSEVLDQIFGIGKDYGKSIQGWLDIVHPEDREMVGRYLREDILSRQKPFDKEYRIVRQSDGETRWVAGLGKVRVNGAGAVVSMFGTIQDITERKRAEERLHQQAALLDAANDAIYIRDLDHTVTYWNQGAERLYGWTSAEVLGRRITDLETGSREEFMVADAALLEQGSWSGELKITGRAGGEFVIFCRWTLLRDAQGRPKEVLAINTDITGRKQLEAQFFRAQRMESIGALAGGIAHDLNNILTPILMNANLLYETTREPDSQALSRDLISTVESCAQRGADIIKQLLTFARGKPGVRTPLPVRHLLNEMDKLIRETFPKNIRVQTSAPQDLWQVLGDATQIHQALMNLCVNARDAMPEGGALALVAANTTLDDEFTVASSEAKPGPHVCIRVTDTGTGIAPQHLDRIFDPFFTTKDVGKGTGLGLATVLGVVRGHGGFVRVDSRIGSGTTFEMYLPAATAVPIIQPHQAIPNPGRGSGELVLVVDDEVSIRGVVRRILEQHGYRVITASEGGEALELFTGRRAEVRVVLTDMVMPGMDGPRLIQALRGIEPRLPILGMTGLAERVGINGFEKLGLPLVLNKPFDRVELLKAVFLTLTAGVAPVPTLTTQSN